MLCCVGGERLRYKDRYLHTDIRERLQTVIRGDSGSIPLPPFRNLGNFVHLTLPVSFGRDTKRR